MIQSGRIRDRQYILDLLCPLTGRFVIFFSSFLSMSPTFRRNVHKTACENTSIASPRSPQCRALNLLGQYSKNFVVTLMMRYGDTFVNTERETDRHSDKSDRPTHRQTDKSNRPTDRQVRQPDRQTDRQTRQTDKTDRQYRQTRQIDKTDRPKDRQTDRSTVRHTDRQAERQINRRTRQTRQTSQTYRAIHKLAIR